MTLKERAGKYRGNTQIKIALNKVNVAIEVNINENGTIDASYSAKVLFFSKSGSTTKKEDPNYQKDDMDLCISGINIHAVFNENKSIDITLPNKILKYKVIKTNVTLQRC